MKSIIIRNGKIVNSNRTYTSDILIVDGKIKAIEKNISEFGSEVKEIDAGSMYVIPGGIDPHVHLELPGIAGNSSDDFKTGSIAAIAGGTTSIIDFVTPEKDEPLLSALEKRKKIAQKSLIDYSFHLSPISWDSSTYKEMEQCVKKEGIISFKTYLAYKNTIGINDDVLLNVMDTAKKLNALVTLHCENGDLIEKLQHNFIASGKTSIKYHPLSRPVEAEAEAVNRAVVLAKYMECPIYIVHVSTKESVDIINKAQQAGQKVFAETCPQYLMLDETVYDKPFYESAPFVISPPLRSHIHKYALWKAVESEIIQTIGTDHCPFNLYGQKDTGINDFTKIPNGAGGIEYRLSLLYTYGVLTNKITMNQFVNLISTNPAKIFGLSHRKGNIAVAMDADIVIWNPEKESVISVKTQRQRCDSNIYQGIKIKGMPEYVIVNGRIACKKGKINTEGLKGRYLFRKFVK